MLKETLVPVGDLGRSPRTDVIASGNSNALGRPVAGMRSLASQKDLGGTIRFRAVGRLPEVLRAGW